MEKRLAEARIREMESEQRLKQEEVGRHEDRQALVCSLCITIKHIRFKSDVHVTC